MIPRSARGIEQPELFLGQHGLIGKKVLRQHLRETLSAITPADRQAASHSACRHLVELPEYRRAEVVMLFLSLPTEVDTTALVLRCWQDDKRVTVPRVSWEERRMHSVEIRSLTDEVRQVDFGLREPTGGTVVPVSMIDLLVVPGLGFDEYGNRLGRGRGFYDRFLANPEFRGRACALAFEAQVVPQVPVVASDKPVHILVTDRRVRRFTDEPAPGAAPSD